VETAAAGASADKPKKDETRGWGMNIEKIFSLHPEIYAYFIMTAF